MAEDMVEPDPQFQRLAGSIGEQIKKHPGAIQVRHHARQGNQDTIFSLKRKDTADGPAQQNMRYRTHICPINTGMALYSS
jgi:hypothetical protein